MPGVTAASAVSLLPRHFYVEQMLLKTQARFLGKAIRIRIQGVEKILNFLLHFLFPAGI